MNQQNQAQKLLRKVAGVAATELKNEAKIIANELVEHAKEEARKMLLISNLDISQIPRICDRVDAMSINLEANTKSTANIQSDSLWTRRIVSGVAVIFIPFLAWLSITTISNGTQLAAVVSAVNILSKTK